MKLHELRSPEGTKKDRKRVGRGIAAGGGKTAGRGMKGQNSRAGGGVSPYFEGGQLPLIRRLPFIRGFTNAFRVEYAVVNIGMLGSFKAGTEVTPDLLHELGIVKAKMPVKILGQGELDHPLTVTASKFSATAREKILAAGGSVVELE